MNIDEFDFLDENFIEQVNDFAKLEPFQLFYLYNAIEMIKYNGVEFYDLFILTNNSCKIIGLCTKLGYYFYGRNWTEAEINFIRRRIDFKTFPSSFHFLGTTSLVNDIFKDSNVQTVDFKDRYFFKINSSPTNEDSSYIITEPNENDIQKLGKLIQESHRKEYKELSIRT